MDLHLTEKEAGQVLAIKRDLHMHPELSHEEFRTTEREKAAGRPAFGRTSMPFRRPSRSKARTSPDARERCTPADTTFTPRRSLEPR